MANGNKIVLDTNVILYLLQGELIESQIPSGRYFISFITELELLSFPKITPMEEQSIRKFLNDINIVDTSPLLKENAILLRKKYHLKLPDAIICATAFILNAHLVSADQAFDKVRSIKTIHLKI